jgi:hypothetical protein
MLPLIFAVGALLGVLAGGALCIHYLRQEVAANVGPELERLQHQADNIEAVLNLALASRDAGLSQRPWPPGISPHQPSDWPE